MTRMRAESVFARGCWIAVLALACLLPLRAGASERVFQFRSLEDQKDLSLVAAPQAYCATAPFKVNVRLPARLWVHRIRAADGRVMNETAEAIGTAYACARITNFLFSAWDSSTNFYAQFNLPSGTYEAAGQCTFISNDV